MLNFDTQSYKQETFFFCLGIGNTCNELHIQLGLILNKIRVKPTIKRYHCLKNENV